MAYTVTYAPPALSSVHDDMIFTVSYPEHTSDPATYPNYKFIADVYIGSTLVARLRKVPDPASGFGIFNIGQIVRNYITATFDPAPGVLVCQVLDDGQFWTQVTLKLGEEYAYTSYYNLVTDFSRTYFNNYNGRLVGITSSLVNSAPAPDRVLSNRPTTAHVLLSSAYYFVPYFSSSATPVSLVITPTGGGAVLSTSFTPSATFVYYLSILNLSPGAINAAAPGTINASTTSYTVQIGSQVYVFKVICEPIFQPFTVHFLNQYGGFDSKIFTKVSRRTYDITKADFGKLAYVIDGAGVPKFKNSNGVYNETRSVYSSHFTEKLTINSDNLTDEEYIWLRDLVISPMVYIEDGGYFFPCLIKDSNYEPKKYINDDLTNLSLNIEFGNQLNAQYR